MGDHAWVDVPGGLVYDAVLGRIYPWEIYHKAVLAEVNKRYNATQVIALARTTNTHGPWTEAEERAAFTFSQ
jgi:hypothetical protein